MTSAVGGMSWLSYYTASGRSDPNLRRIRSGKDDTAGTSSAVNVRGLPFPLLHITAPPEEARGRDCTIPLVLFEIVDLEVL